MHDTIQKKPLEASAADHHHRKTLPSVAQAHKNTHVSKRGLATRTAAVICSRNPPVISPRTRPTDTSFIIPCTELSQGLPQCEPCTQRGLKLGTLQPHTRPQLLNAPTRRCRHSSSTGSHSAPTRSTHSTTCIGAAVVRCTYTQHASPHHTGSSLRILEAAGSPGSRYALVHTAQQPIQHHHPCKTLIA